MRYITICAVIHQFHGKQTKQQQPFKDNKQTMNCRLSTLVVAVLLACTALGWTAHQVTLLVAMIMQAFR